MMVLVLGMGVSGAWGQTITTLTQTVCPGSEPYLVNPENPANTLLWSISTGTQGVHWTITSPNTASTNVIWENLTALPVIYTLTFTEDNGTCQTIRSVDVTVNPRPVAPTATATLQPTCAVATGTITVTAPTGTGMTYSIDGSTYTNTTGIFTLVAAGNYTVTARNSDGCTSTGTSVTINAQPLTPAAPTASATLQPTCAVATGTITVTAPTGTGMTYSIDGSTYTNTTGIFTLVAVGNYTVTARNSDGCTSTGTSVTINAQPASPSTSPIFHN